VAQKQSIEIKKLLNRIVPKRRIEEIARETGAWSRDRKILASSFFWSVVLGFSAGRSRTLAGLRRSFEKSTGRSVVASSFYGRFTPRFVKLLRVILSEIMAKAEPDFGSLTEAFAIFRDILITDSTLIRLHDLLEKSFPSVWTNHTKASVKAHVIMSVKSGGMNSVKLTSGSTQDGRRFRAGRWMKDKLMIFDLGFYRYQLFACIERQGGYFLSRLKKKANPPIIKCNRNHRGIQAVGLPLNDYLKLLRGKPVDVEVELEYYKNQHRKQQWKRHALRLRIVGIFNSQSKSYHLYITNVPPSVFDAEQVARVYGARWFVELLFRELKSQYRLEEIPSRKKHVVEALVYAALITLAGSRAFLAEIKRTARNLRDRLPEERWAILWATIASELLAVVSRKNGDKITERYVNVMIYREAVDPNRARKPLRAKAFG
jgi:IS4 transposase